MNSLSQDALRVEPLPVLSPCYCEACKTPISRAQVMDDKHAWCPSCEGIVRTSWFQVQGWVVGCMVLMVTLTAHWI